MVKKITQTRFFTDFYKMTADKKIPFEASFELTHNCNLHCRHCYIPRGKNIEARSPGQEELSCSEICSILDQLADMGCFHLDLTGGEIFTRPDILEILDYAKKRGFYTVLLSNGTLITPELADQLKDLRVDEIGVSIYGITEKSYKAITQVSGSFHRCLQGINLLLERDISICLKMTVTTLNADEFSEVKAFAKDIGVRFQWGHLIFPKIDGSKEPLAFRCSPEEAIRLEARNQPGLFEEEKGSRKERKSSCSNGDLFHCNAGKNSLAITPYGELILCLEYRFPKYDLRRGNLSQGWKELENYVKSARPTATYRCADCELGEFCQWCPAEGWLNEDDRNNCVPYFKELARTRKEWIERG